MTSLPSIPDGEHDSSRSDTPLASHRLSSAIGHAVVLVPDSQPISSSPLQPPASTDAHTSPLLLPVQAPSTANTGVSFALPGAHDIRTIDPLPPELASADINFAREFPPVFSFPSVVRSSTVNECSYYQGASFLPSVRQSKEAHATANTAHTHSFTCLVCVFADEGMNRPYVVKLYDVTDTTLDEIADGTFVETSSGLVARELKKRYDQQLGVGMSVRSPYAITAFINQHGKQMYRIGHRELLAPAASAAQVEELVTQPRSPPSDGQHPTHSKRRSRMSMHTLLPPSMFKTALGSRPQTSAPPSRKLRKTRSIPDMSDFTFGAFSPTSTAPWPQSVTGRAHAHSVTGTEMSAFPMPSTDAPRSPARTGDIFSDTMGWDNPSSSAKALLFSLQLQEVPSLIIVYPFGSGVAFDSAERPATDFLPAPPHILREVHSFESGLTARQTDTQASPSQEEATPEIPEKFSSRSPSISSVKKASPITPQEDEGWLLLPETCLHSQYSTDVFDVLQTYRGLPRLEKISPGSAETTVIKMSLAADDSAAPKDDPRFVIWGEIVSEHDSDDLSISQESFTDLSSSMHSSVASRKRSLRSQTHEAPSVRLTSGVQKLVVAATIERWIGQLTSELNYDELLNFFLTYRTYITAVDLCHLLICRFHWALGRASSPQDEKVRRVVRVRTFVAFRYWLLTFFAVDFIPNRELRLLVANWLNCLARDPILEKHLDGLSIVRKLKKVVKDCKEAHTPSSVKTTSKHRESKVPRKTTHVLGEKFAEAIASQNYDSDVDLDFLPDEVAPVTDTPRGYNNDLPNAHLSAGHLSAALSPTAFPLTAFSVLQQTPPVADEAPSASLPVHHNVISRAFVKTIGQLGRWKRVLNARSAVRPPLAPCAGVSAFDLDLAGAAGNLLAIDNEVEKYLKMVERQAPPISVDDTLDIERPSMSLSVAPTLDGSDAVSPANDGSADFSDVIIVGPEYSEPPVIKTEVVAESADVAPAANAEPIEPESSEPATESRLSKASTSNRSSSTDSLGELLSPNSRAIDISAPEPSPWGFDVVSIDDLDLSDTSSILDFASPPLPPGLRKMPRKLPLRRDFEFVRRSESASSTGIDPRDSMASVATSSIISTSSAGGGLGGTILPWQMTALVDSLSDDGESGNVEAALRRLEGQINPQKKKEKASKVDGWVKTIQERLAAGDYTNEEPAFLSDEEDEVEEQVLDESKEGGESAEDVSEIQEIIIDYAGPNTLSLDIGGGEHLQLATTPLANQTTHRTLTPTPPSPIRKQESQQTAKGVPAALDFQPRSSARLSLSEPKRISLSLGFRNSDMPRTHRSFILAFRAETLVEHFSMIDRELFMSIKFEELVSQDWTSCEEVNVLDWTQFLKDRARWKSESLWPQKTTALAAVRARFNLIANFTLSEVVLTQPSERALVASKFIRIAWKAYSLRNFHTLVAIIAGLRSEWVNKAMRRSWNRIGVWETRMYKDLMEFTTSVDDFKYIRRTIEAMTDAKQIDVGSRSGSIVSSGPTDGGSKTNLDLKIPARSCVPFIGVYLSQLYGISQLPDLVDPTAPNEAVRIDPVTSNFDAPAHPEVFASLAPLPSSMQLEPLINVHKQRLIAGVIKSLVAGQHHASRVQFSIDKKTLQKCLKLRALDSDTLHRALSRYPD